MSSAARSIGTSRGTARWATGTTPVRRNTRPQPAKLRLVVPSLARRRMSSSAVFIGVLVLGLLGVLVANIYISHSTYRVQQLAGEQQQLHDQRDRLSEDISYRSSPQNIQHAAEQAGMVRAKDPSFIRRSDGTVIPVEKAVEISGKSDETVPGPRADTREDPRPNLRSDEKLPTVGGSGDELKAPQPRAAHD